MPTLVLRLVLLLALASGCSALIDPDPDRLGGDGVDGGGDGGRDDGGRDGGGGDGARPDAPGEDAGLPDGGVPDGGGCPPDCSDGVDCTDDRCEDDRCVHDPDDDLCEDEERCNPVMGCVPQLCERDEQCNDGVFCNGMETCRPGMGADPDTGCQMGDRPRCDDRIDCTIDTCDPDLDTCTASPIDSRCEDGLDCTADDCDPVAGCTRRLDDFRCDDGVDCTVDRCVAGGGGGCVNEPDDGLCASVFCVDGQRCDPGAGCVGGAPRDCRDFTACTIDSCSDALMMCVHELRDEDGDGHPAAFISFTRCEGGTDCDDGDETVHPGAIEYCNGRNDDCDMSVDESCSAIPDDCDDAQAITLVGGSAVVTGTLGIFSDGYRTLCGRDGGRDAVYYVDVRGVSDIEIDTIGSEADTVLAVSTTCGSFGAACDDDARPGAVVQSRVWAHRIGNATSITRLFILVDGVDGAARGDFTLTVRSSPAAADTCVAPLDISSGGTVVGVITGSAVTGTTGSCSTDVTEREAVLTLVGPTDGDARLQALSTDFSPDLYVRNAPCATGMEIACVNAMMLGGLFSATTTVPIAAGSRAFVFVDGVPATTIGPVAYVLSYNP